jgi:hypothetical protein
MRVAHSVWLTETRLSYRAQTPSETDGRVQRDSPAGRVTGGSVLAQLEAALKNARPVQFKENIALVLKYFDKLAPLMQEQDSELRPAD